MIGVAVPSTERDIVAEFFELFKTPWEFQRPGVRYDVLLCTHETALQDAKLVLFYQSEPMPFDRKNKIAVRACHGGAISHARRHLPLYGKAAAFLGSDFKEVTLEPSRHPAAYLLQAQNQMVMRIGYDLFEEIRFLLLTGQPQANAGAATLEWHIALLREFITGSGLPLLEIPPIPDGHAFMACLTHDLDHPVLRNHCCDHTMFGFLYRASFGSLMDACRGRRPWRSLRRNWGAACALPFVFAGAARDPWRQFDDYLEIEAGLGATYFVIPRKDYPGRRANGTGPARRAARYTIEEIQPQLQRIAAAGNELALHGIDAWLDSPSGREEQGNLARTVGATDGGVRMHWLFYSEKSPAVLEQAGFSYDSSFGYNETVGYRAGTAQPFKPRGAANLLELPLIVMDTALFYPGHLNLGDSGAERVVWQVMDDIAQAGGVLTINWHDRSIAPERLWGGFYRKLLDELKGRGAWFPTAAQAIAWFRKRRSAVFEAVKHENDVINFKISSTSDAELPGLRVRVHKPKASSWQEAPRAGSGPGFVDVPCRAGFESSIAISA